MHSSLDAGLSPGCPATPGQAGLAPQGLISWASLFPRDSMEVRWGVFGSFKDLGSCLCNWETSTGLCCPSWCTAFWPRVSLGAWRWWAWCHLLVQGRRDGLVAGQHAECFLLGLGARKELTEKGNSCPNGKLKLPCGGAGVCVGVILSFGLVCYQGLFHLWPYKTRGRKGTQLHCADVTLWK